MWGKQGDTVDTVDARIREFTDEQRAADAAEARRREHWLRRQASEEGTFDGVLLDLGEREQLLAVSTVTGRVLRGVVRTIGGDFLGLRAPSGEGALVPLRSVTTVRPEPGSRPTVGDRLVQMDATLISVLANLATQRPQTSLHTLGGEGFTGLLHSVGQDLLVLQGPSGEETYVPMVALADVMFP